MSPSLSLSSLRRELLLGLSLHIEIHGQSSGREGGADGVWTAGRVGARVGVCGRVRHVSPGPSWGPLHLTRRLMRCGSSLLAQAAPTM